MSVSVLLPSRGRYQSLIDSIASLKDNAADPDLVEILVAADPDDTLTTEIAAAAGYRTWIAPERYGYGRLNQYFNHLATMATGTWLLLWNDDARMLTSAWDSWIEGIQYAYPDAGVEILVADLWSEPHSPDLCTFPAVKRWAVEVVGGFSPHTPHCDTWWQDISRQLGAIRPVPVHVDHQRADISGLHHDTTYLEGVAQYRTGEFYGAEVQSHLTEAVEALRIELIERDGRCQPIGCDAGRHLAGCAVAARQGGV